MKVKLSSLTPGDVGFYSLHIINPDISLNLKFKFIPMQLFGMFMEGF